MKPIKGSYHYRESGLENVYLANGYDYVQSPGGRSVVIQDIDGLHEAIGRFLVNERKVLSGPEIRFLRHELTLSQKALADTLDVTEQTVRRWEQGKLDIPRSADAILRSLYEEKIEGNGKVSEILKRIADAEDQTDRRDVMLEEESEGWAVAA